MKKRSFFSIRGIANIMQENGITWSITKHEDGKRWNLNAEKDNEPIFKTILKEEEIIAKMKESASVWPSPVFQNHPEEVIRAKLTRILFKELTHIKHGEKYIDTLRHYPNAEIISI